MLEIWKLSLVSVNSVGMDKTVALFKPCTVVAKNKFFDTVWFRFTASLNLEILTTN